MNEPHPIVPPIPAAPLPYKDRSAGLVVFGIGTLCLGVLAALLIPLMFLVSCNIR